MSDEVLLAAAAHLTDRDRRLVRLVGEHRVLTTGQLAAAGFGSVITARHRLTVLVKIGVLRRFRPHREVGSAPWHYLLGPAGAALLGAEDGDERKWLAAVRADRQVALARSQRLADLAGVNWFFTALAAHARSAGSGAELRAWLNEAVAGEWLLERLPPACCCSAFLVRDGSRPPAGRWPPAVMRRRCGSQPPPPTRSRPARPGRSGCP